MKEMPNVLKLMEWSNLGKYISVAYHHSTLIRTNAELPVVAYGVGYCGFAVVIKSEKGVYKAYSAGAKHPHARQKDSGFAEIPIEDALTLIKTNKFLTIKDIDEEEVKKYEESKPEIVASCVRTGWHNNEPYEPEKYQVIRKKNGKLGFLAQDRWQPIPRRTNVGHVAKMFALALGKAKFKKDENKSWINKYTFDNVNISEEIYTEVAGMALVEQI